MILLHSSKLVTEILSIFIRLPYFTADETITTSLLFVLLLFLVPTRVYRQEMVKREQQQHVMCYGQQQQIRQSLARVLKTQDKEAYKKEAWLI